jgi:4-diphosphocytidyl-2C-methyl-D-erythritol kinase
MTISKDLFLSILAMDSYNRGYNAGVGGLSDSKGTKIGSATISTLLSDVAQGFEAKAQSAGFYALAYDIGADGPEGVAGKTLPPA